MSGIRRYSGFSKGHEEGILLGVTIERLTKERRVVVNAFDKKSPKREPSRVW